MTIRRFFLLVSILVAGCATQPERREWSRASEGTWSAKAQITHLKSNQKDQVSLDFHAVKPDRMRMEVSGTMGVALASLVLNKDEIAYSLYRQKKYFSGLASKRALRPLFHVNVDPRWLLNICFDLPIRGEGWSCEFDSERRVKSCIRSDQENSSEKWEISWESRNQEQKRVLLKHPEFEINIAFKSFSPSLSSKTQDPSRIFQLNQPDGFESYKLP